MVVEDEDVGVVVEVDVVVVDEVVEGVLVVEVSEVVVDEVVDGVLVRSVSGGRLTEVDK